MATYVFVSLGRVGRIYLERCGFPLTQVRT